jgi:hypothetical protein
MQTRLEHPSAFDAPFPVRELGLEDVLASEHYLADYSRMTKHLPIQSLYTSHYLCTAEPHLGQLVSPENFKEIISLARFFPGNLTSFCGFECRLGDATSRTDWAFAVSGAGNDRNVLTNLLSHEYLPGYFFQEETWQRVRHFANRWSAPSSILQDKIQCFWLEFDMPNPAPQIPIPSVFFGPAKLPAGKRHTDVSQYNWLITSALPLLRGHRVLPAIQKGMRNAIRNLPDNATLFQVGTLLSREKNDNVRFYVNHLTSSQIISYLETCKWEGDTSTLFSLLRNLGTIADRLVLGFDITASGIDSRIGVECSFLSDAYHEETRWRDLLDVLVSRKLCLPERRDALLAYPGVEGDEDVPLSIMKPLASASQHLMDLMTSKIVRYISHLKIVYDRDHFVEAKAYPAVRLFKNGYSGYT